MKRIILLGIIGSLFLSSCAGDTGNGRQETYKIIVGQMSTRAEAAAKECVRKMTEETNIEVEWVEIPIPQWDEKINALFMANELPDAIIGNIQHTPQYYSKLTPLDDLIEAYAPNIKAFLEKYPEYQQVLRGQDGLIYGLPIGDESVHNLIDSQMWINARWLEESGLPMPETTAELKTVLEYFRDHDMNGNGLVVDEIPLTFTAPWGWSTAAENLFGSFGAPENNYHVFISPEDQQTVVFSPTQPGYYECLAWLHELYEQRLLDPDILLQSSYQYENKNANGRDIVGVYFGYGNTGLANPDLDFIHVPQLSGPAGESMLVANPITRPIGFTIPKTCQNPEVMIRLYDYINGDLETIMTWNRGVEGVNWEWRENEQGETVPSLIYRTTAQWQELGYNNLEDARARESFAGWSPAVWTREVAGLVLDNQPESDVKLEAVNRDLQKSVPGLPPGNDTAENSRKRALLLADLDTYLKRFVSDSVINGIDMDKWARHLKELEALGAQEYIRLCQEYMKADSKSAGYSAE